jgi:hypothetical protein
LRDESTVRKHGTTDGISERLFQGSTWKSAGDYSDWTGVKSWMRLDEA